jgi:membrane fusion protein (multidrug efflux system)
MSVVLSAIVSGCGDASRAAAPPPPPTVVVELVVAQDVPVSAEWVGTLVGYIKAQIRPRVSGHLMSQNYKEGAMVKAGDLLFQVDQAIAKVAQSEADLKRSEADQRRTELDVGRYAPLAERGSVSKQELDNAG